MAGVRILGPMRTDAAEPDGVVPGQLATVPMRLVRRGRHLVVEPDEPLPALMAREVREVLEAGRR